MNNELLFSEGAAQSADAPSRTRINRLWLLLVAMAVCVPLWNVVVDPYDVFGTQYFNHPGDRNERYAKLEALLEQKKQRQVYDALVVGASTAGVFHTAELNRRFSERRFYNAAMLSAGFSEIEALLRFHHQSINPLKQVVLTVDLFQFVDSPSQGGFMSQHPAISGQSKVSFFWGELWSSSVAGGVSKLIVNGRGTPHMSTDLHTGDYRYGEPTERRSQLVDLAWESRNAARQHRLREDAIAQLLRIVAWCQQENITITLLPSPRADGGDASMVERLQREVALAAFLVLPPLVSKSDFYDATHFTGAFASRWLDSIPRLPHKR
ncbi:MAG: hypothetical protein EAZ30_02800 [Betaproteobacteria bacterium]|nr:MAG: hypothetical protein EAZ30_02800 [Betaproteobacteria bacterium]